MQLRLLTLGVCALTSPAAALLLQRPVPLRARHSSAPAAEPQLPHLCLRHGCGSRSRTIVAREMTDIENQEAYEALIADATKEDRLVVIKFYASWCRACKAMAPKIDAIAEEWPGVIDHSHSPIAPRPTPRTHSKRAPLTALPPPRPLLRGTATRCVRRDRVLPAHVRQQQEAVQEPGDQGAAVPRDHRGQQGQGRVLQLRPLEDIAAAGEAGGARV
eukprot:Transcript_9713.p2 GENE.Transcript_9713~~Transcript_9713.p2  ORF type:complete len:217 (+),score=29.44 Transcript_9713:54-704(+)